MIVREGAPILRQTCTPFAFPGDTQALVTRMTQAMQAERGLGLAAPQIGEAVRAFVLADGASVIACFNPAIISRSGGEERGQEGCLSYPGIFVYVRRSRCVLVRFQDVGGEWRAREFVGMQARAFQHELDHLDGRTLPDLVPAQAFALARAKRKIAA